MTIALKDIEALLEAPNDGIPTLYEELNRKTLDVALDLVSGFESQKISSAQLYTGFNVLFSTVSGLASKEAIEFAFEGSKMVAKYSDNSFSEVRTFFNKESGIIIINFEFGRGMVRLNSYDSFGDFHRKGDFAVEKLGAVIESLTKIGYRELT